MRKRVAAIIIKDNKILLTHRFKDGKEYYVLPGGGVEENESIENAMIREAKEELSLDVKVDKLLFQIENRGQEESYFLIKQFFGTPTLGGPEKERMNERNQYYPEWVLLKRIKELKLFPEAIKEKILDLAKNKKLKIK